MDEDPTSYASNIIEDSHITPGDNGGQTCSADWGYESQSINQSPLPTSRQATTSRACQGQQRARWAKHSVRAKLLSTDSSAVTSSEEEEGSEEDSDTAADRPNRTKQLSKNRPLPQPSRTGYKTGFWRRKKSVALAAATSAGRDSDSSDETDSSVASSTCDSTESAFWDKVSIDINGAKVQG